jgi:hypothetical protein
MHTIRYPLLRVRTRMPEARARYLGSSHSSRLALRIASRFLRFEPFKSSQPATLSVCSNRPFRDRLLSDGSSGDDKHALANKLEKSPRPSPNP